MFTFILWFVVRTSGLIERRRARHLLFQGWTILIALYFITWMVTKPAPLPKTLLITPFATQMSEPWIGEALGDKLGEQLASSSFGLLELPWEVCPQIRQSIPPDSMWLIIKRLQPTIAVWGIVRGRPDSLWVESHYAKTKWGRTVRFAPNTRRYSTMEDAAIGVAELAKNAALIRQRDVDVPKSADHPIEAQRKYYLARERLRSNSPESALELAREAIALDSKWTDAWLVAAISEVEGDDTLFNPIDAFRKAISLDSLNLAAWQQLARYAILNHRWNLADSSLKKAYHLGHKNPVTLYLISHLNMNRALSISKMTPNRAAELALAIHPGYLNARLMVAQYYYSIGDLRKCRSVTRRGLETNPNSWELWQMQSNLDLHEGKFQSALTAIKEARQLGGDHPDILYNIGITYFYLDSLPQSKAYLTQSVQLKASSDAYYLLGQCAERQGDSSQAALYYQKSVESSTGSDDRSAQEAAKKVRAFIRQ
jgi:tetratricopeptide (TPR) repeat protein